MKIKEFIERNIKWIVLFVCLILVIIIAVNVLNNKINKFDITGYKIMSKYLISENMTPIVKIITQFGGATVLILLTIILFIVIKNKKTGLYISINLATVALFNQILKHIIQRPRPTEFRIIDEIGYSFPSGHSMTGTAFYGLLIYLVYKNVKNKYLKWILITILSLLIVLIGTSRIYLGVHYTSDVLAGFLIAISYLIIFVTILNVISKK